MQVRENQGIFSHFVESKKHIFANIPLIHIEIPKKVLNKSPMVHGGGGGRRKAPIHR